MIVHPLLLFHAATLSEKLNKPFIMATPFPIAPATKQFPKFLVRAKRLPLGLLNLLSHRVFAKLYEKGKAADMNEWRAKLGLAPLRGSLFKNLADQSIPILHAYSPTLVPHPDDWREHNLISGQWKLNVPHLPEQAKAESNADLDQWLDRGQAPIYFGFGSLPVLEPQKMMDMVLDITKSLNTRAIAASGWSGMTADGSSLPDSIFMIGSAILDC